MSSTVDLRSLKEALDSLLLGIRRKERFSLGNGIMNIVSENGSSTIATLNTLLQEFPNSGLNCGPIENKVNAKTHSIAHTMQIRFKPDPSKKETPQEQCNKLAEKIMHFTSHNLLGNIVREVRETVHGANMEITKIGVHFPLLAQMLREEMVVALQGEMGRDNVKKAKSA